VNPRKAPFGFIAVLLFGSGACALVYQIAWLRELRLVFGSSTAASAAVLAVFMAGMGLGGARLGASEACRVRPLRLYADLELCVAASAAATPLLVWLARTAYVGLGGTPALGDFGATLVRLVFSALVLGVPAFLMGGTLPAAAQAVAGGSDRGRRSVAVLYGVNTLGAVAGTLVATFALLEVLGTRRLLWSAAVVNALVALAARAWPGRAGAVPAGAGDPRPPPPAVERIETFPLVAAAVAGFVFLLMELVWYRVVGPLLGGSSFSFGLILAVALAGMGAGSVAYATFGGGRRGTARGFALTCGAQAACLALPFALGDHIAIWSSLLQALAAVGFGGQVAAWSAATLVIVFPAAFVAGVQFPLLLAWAGGRPERVGREVGLVYAWSTAGAIAGSLSGGFGLLPLLSATGAWRLAVVMLVVLAGGAVVRGGASWRQAIHPVGLAALAVACICAPGPTAVWRHAGVGVGLGPRNGTPSSIEDWMNEQRRSLLWEADGRESSVAATVGDGYAFVVNGKVDGHARGDARTQVMGGLLGAILHGHVKRAAIVGLGTGSTAGWLAAVPGVEQVDVAELEPAILRVARESRSVNRAVMDNPKVRVLLGDGRELLSTARAQYDLVFSEPSNPYRAGVASLFTVEFYRAVDARLARHGVLVQWVQAYAVDVETIRTIYATLARVFASVETWSTTEGDLMLVASQGPPDHDVPTLRARIAEEPYRSALENAWMVDDLEGFYAHFVARDGLADALAGAGGDRLNTDDRPLIEFRFARSAATSVKLFDLNDLRETARQRGEDQPLVTGGDLDGDRLLARRLSMWASQRVPLPPPTRDAPESLRRRAVALGRWLEGQCPSALHAWGDETPADPVERLAIADCLADAGDEAALLLIAALRARRPIEADALLARLRARQGRPHEAGAALERAFTAYRTDPWPMPFVMSRALTLTRGLARTEPAVGRRLHQLLGRPFAAHVLDGARRSTRLFLAGLVDFRGLCRDEVASFEPWIPWRRDFLATRLRCYEENGDPRARRARRDLARFEANEPAPLAAQPTP
jgi:spermidine synthase